MSLPRKNSPSYARFTLDALRKIARRYGMYELPIIILRRQSIAKARGKNWRNVR